MDITTIIGLVLGFFGIIFGFILEGGHVASLFALSPVMIVILGTLGATIIGIPLQEIKKLPQWLKIAFTNQSFGVEKAYYTLVHFAEKARQEGLLSLEQELETIEDKFTKQGMQLVLTEQRSGYYAKYFGVEHCRSGKPHKVGISFFEAAGGTVRPSGLSERLWVWSMFWATSSDPDTLSSSIAAAFICHSVRVCLATCLSSYSNKAKNQESNGQFKLLEMIHWTASSPSSPAKTLPS
jgi:chemotaxis protein MotA